MKVLLVQPIRPKERVVHVVPPLGLGYLATAIRDQHEVSILDCVKEGANYQDFGDRLAQVNPDVVGVNLFSNGLSSTKKMLEMVKRFNPQILTVVGGPHPSAVGEEIFSHLPEVDFAFKGEGEIGFPLLLDFQTNKGKAGGRHGKDRYLAQIPGLIYRNGPKVKSNSPIFAENLDELGWPAWDLICPDTYPVAPHGMYAQNSPIGPIIVTRGCPFPCTFCAGSTVLGKRFRFRSIQNVIKEIKLLKDQFRVKEIQILDDNFTLDRNYVQEFCRSVIENKLNLSFSCPNGVRLDTLDKETLIMMKQAGWYLIAAGIESGSPKILEAMKKKITVERTKQQISLIKEIGLEAHGFFIIGYPGETREDIKMTIRFAKELGLDWAFFGNFIPLPGTEIYRELLKRNEIEAIDWDSLYVGGNVLYSPEGISPKELKRLQQRAFLQFYIQSKIIVNFLSKIRINNLRMMVKRALFILLPRRVKSRKFLDL